VETSVDEPIQATLHEARSLVLLCCLSTSQPMLIVIHSSVAKPVKSNDYCNYK
jgi:hypothetical protein